MTHIHFPTDCIIPLQIALVVMLDEESGSYTAHEWCQHGTNWTLALEHQHLLWVFYPLLTIGDWLLSWQSSNHFADVVICNSTFSEESCLIMACGVVNNYKSWYFVTTLLVLFYVPWCCYSTQFTFWGFFIPKSYSTPKGLSSGGFHLYSY
jgi:hypothetical protein